MHTAMNTELIPLCRSEAAEGTGRKAYRNLYTFGFPCQQRLSPTFEGNLLQRSGNTRVRDKSACSLSGLP